MHAWHRGAAGDLHSSQHSKSARSHPAPSIQLRPPLTTGCHPLPQLHPFFAGLDFEAVMQRSVPPPLPQDTILSHAAAKHSSQVGERRRSLDRLEEGLINFLNTPASELCAAAAEGDLELLKELLAKGIEVDASDYDKRTALHVGASEGHLSVVQHLLNEAGAEHSPLDRWGHITRLEANAHRQRYKMETHCSFALDGYAAWQVARRSMMRLRLGTSMSSAISRNSAHSTATHAQARVILQRTCAMRRRLVTSKS